MDRIIAKAEIISWLLAHAERYRVIGPVAQTEGPAVYRDIDSNSEIVLGNESWTMPPREMQIIEPYTDGRPLLLMGLRLCDARAIQVLDRVYLNGPFKDPYYAAKRENSILIGTVCAEPRWSCFCTSVGGPIEWTKLLDVTLTDIGERLYITANTEAAEALLSAASLAEPTEEQKRMKEAAWQALAASPMRPFAGRDISAALEWDHPVWAEIADRCLACGICNYLCPSCSCFDIQDEVVRLDCVERFRCRDTCQFSDFTRMGAGHNPRAAQLPRSRQRIMHKFRYQPEQIGTYGCSGCGRCIEACPVNIDIRRILEAMVMRPAEVTE